MSPYCNQFGGLVLNATVDRYCYCTLEERRDDRTVFRAADVGLESTNADAGPLVLHQAVHERLRRDFQLGRPALTVTTVSEAPPGSGLGSSSTVVVSILDAYREMFSLPLTEHDLARLAFEIERVDCGLHGGRQDQYAATFGGFNMMEFGPGERAVINPLRLKPAIIQEFEASLVLFHTGVSRQSADIIDRQTAHIAEGAADRVAATHQLRQEAVAMKDALIVGDFERMAEVMASGWSAKKRLADGISNPVIDAVFDAALDAGALAGKISGAGGGGHIMFIVDPVQKPRVLDVLGRHPLGSVTPIHFVPEGAVAWTLR